MKVTDYIASFLHKQGVTHVFELSGGMITHILDSLFRQKKIQIVTMHHEQGASFAADAYARVTGIPGVALATSGPGATNLLTGIASCYFDSVPAVFITGQVNQSEQKGAKPIRQLGFQETDVLSMATPITKAVFAVQTGHDVPEIFAKAFEIALSGRPGPVLIDIPMNLQNVDINVEEPVQKVNNKRDAVVIKDSVWEQLFTALKNAKRPLILAGRGVVSDAARDALVQFAEYINVPVVTSLMAVDAIPFTHQLRVGFIGSYGNRWANLAIGDSDCMIVIGSRLDIRQTGVDTKGFIGSKTIFHIEIEEGEINNRVKGCIPLICPVNSFLKQVINKAEQLSFSADYSEWLSQIDELKKRWPDTREISDINGINPNEFMHQLSKFSGQAVAYIADVGSHQMWAAQSLELYGRQYFITSGGMGAMGFALPAAIGASFGSGKKPVVMISGDGGFQLNIQELQTIVRNKLPVKMVVMNNQSLGMIRQFQDSYFDSQYQSTMWGYSAPDFEKLAIAYGIQATTIDKPEEAQIGLEKLWHQKDTPFLLQVMINPFANVYPKIAFGKPITEMEPFSKPIDMEGT